MAMVNVAMGMFFYGLCGPNSSLFCKGCRLNQGIRFNHVDFSSCGDNLATALQTGSKKTATEKIGLLRKIKTPFRRENFRKWRFISYQNDAIMQSK